MSPQKFGFFGVFLASAISFSAHAAPPSSEVCERALVQGNAYALSKILANYGHNPVTVRRLNPEQIAVYHSRIQVREAESKKTVAEGIGPDQKVLALELLEEGGLRMRTSADLPPGVGYEGLPGLLPPGQQVEVQQERFANIYDAATGQKLFEQKLAIWPGAQKPGADPLMSKSNFYVLLGGRLIVEHSPSERFLRVPVMNPEPALAQEMRLAEGASRVEKTSRRELRSVAPYNLLMQENVENVRSFRIDTNLMELVSRPKEAYSVGKGEKLTSIYSPESEVPFFYVQGVEQGIVFVLHAERFSRQKLLSVGNIAKSHLFLTSLDMVLTQVKELQTQGWQNVSLSIYADSGAFVPGGKNEAQGVIRDPYQTLPQRESDFAALLGRGVRLSVNRRPVSSDHVNIVVTPEMEVIETVEETGKVHSVQSIRPL
ncbi:MAG: hypothetical protein AB1540_02975 [Bdellovibrionota bacterium]